MGKYWLGVFERICLNPRTTAAGVASAAGLGAYIFGLNIDANVIEKLAIPVLTGLGMLGSFLGKD